MTVPGVDADTGIVGAGYTGLTTARRLTQTLDRA
jgi:glycine/D-amino acid oxidase-like deaminating enzyme